MKKGLPFLLVFLLTMLCWVLLGYLLHFIVAWVSVYVCFIIGIVAGLFLATLFAFVREDVPVPLSTAELDKVSSSDSKIISSDIRSNAVSNNKTSKQE